MVERVNPRRPRRLFIKEWRERRALTQEELAARVGCEGATISRYEKGVRRVGAQAAAAIADALIISVAALYHHPDEPSIDQLLNERRATKEQREEVLRVVEAILASNAVQARKKA